MRWDSISGQFRVFESSGGSGQQQQAPTSTTTTQVNYSPEEAAQRAALMADARGIYYQTKDKIAQGGFPGSKPVDFSSETEQAQRMLAGYSTGAGAQMANQAGGFSSFLMGPAQYAEANPYLQSAMGAAVKPITQAYTDPGGVFSQIRTGAQNAGQYGGSRQGIAEGIAGREYLQTVGDVTGKMASENYQNAQKAGAQALALAPQTWNLGTNPALTLSGVGQQKEIMAQSLEDYEMQKRMWDINSQWTPLQNYANIVFGGSSPGTTTTSTGTPLAQQRSGGMGALGGALSGAAMGSTFGPWGALIGAGAGLLMG